jgi:hypothetical protein
MEIAAIASRFKVQSQIHVVNVTRTISFVSITGSVLVNAAFFWNKETMNIAFCSEHETLRGGLNHR